MFALTTKNGHTRIYLTEGTQPASAAINERAGRQLLADGPGRSAGRDAARLAGARRAPPPDRGDAHVPADVHGLAVPDVAGRHATRTSPTTAFCTQQCWYDQDVYTPAGLPDTVYVIGSIPYGEQPCNTNGVGCGNGTLERPRGPLLDDRRRPGRRGDGHGSMRTFTDLSYDATINHPSWCAYAPYFDNGCENAPNGIHPDQHVIGINPANPTQIFEGSDGGMIRTSGSFADVSSQCDSPHRNGGGPLPPTSGSYTTCKRLLSRVPTLLEHIDKKLGSTIQFINVAINPASDCEVMGGTQDNGTWSNNERLRQQDVEPGHLRRRRQRRLRRDQPTWRFNEFTSGFSDSNFDNGDPEKWVITSAPVARSGEGPAFYWPQIADPNPVPGTHPIYSGARHVWRTWAFGAGHLGAVPQDTTPDIALYEANCPEFVVGGHARTGAATTGRWAARTATGSPARRRSRRASTSPATSRARSTAPTGAAARSRGSRATRPTTARSGSRRRPAASSSRTTAMRPIRRRRRGTGSTARPSGGSPTRFPSGIYVDPDDTGHAWISYSGYNAVTPTTPGHVFDVHENGTVTPGSGTFTNLNVESGTSAFPTPTNDGDLPVSDVVRDDSSDTLYVSTDFGVLRGDDDGTGGWHVTEGMPRYEVMHLEIQPSSRVATCAIGKKCKPVLYAATHSQGIWKMDLKK